MTTDRLGACLGYVSDQQKGSQRVGKHNDLMFALALALWRAERGAGAGNAPIVGGRPGRRAGL